VLAISNCFYFRSSCRVECCHQRRSTNSAVRASRKPPATVK